MEKCLGGGGGGAETKCKEGWKARHYEMLFNLKPVINNLGG